MTKEQELIIYEIKNQCDLALKNYAYERIDDEVFRDATKALIDAVDPFWLSKEIADYKVICDRSNNTKQTIQNNELHGRVVVLFNKSDAIEGKQIVLDFMLGPSII